MNKTLEQYTDLVFDLVATYVQGEELGELVSSQESKAVIRFAWCENLKPSRVAHWLVD